MSLIYKPHRVLLINLGLLRQSRRSSHFMELEIQYFSLLCVRRIHSTSSPTTYIKTCFIIVLISTPMSSSVFSFVSCCTKPQYSFRTPATLPTNHIVLCCSQLIFSNEQTSRRLWYSGVCQCPGIVITLVSRNSNQRSSNFFIHQLMHK